MHPSQNLGNVSFKDLKNQTLLLINFFGITKV